jgi:hypothetical protein
MSTRKRAAESLTGDLRLVNRRTYRPLMKALSLAIAGMLAAVWAADTPARAGERTLTVVELFTSQGCSSCPPAEAFLGKLSKRPDILALEIHVDYWDYIGWKDPFATAASTERQRRYNKRLGRGYVYTPQVVVDGVAEGVGSDKQALLNAIETARKPGRKQVDVRVATTGKGRLTVELPAGEQGTLYDVLLVGFDELHQTKVLKGENIGKTLNNYNVVREFQRVGFWSGQPATIELPKLDADAMRSWAVIVQAEDAGEILGAARIGSEMLTSNR